MLTLFNNNNCNFEVSGRAKLSLIIDDKPQIEKALLDQAICWLQSAKEYFSLEASFSFLSFSPFSFFSFSRIT